jgi:tRNA (guanine-N7-)-methyltransferase
MSQLNPDDFIITRKRKLYKFALFANSPLCFEADEWTGQIPATIVELAAGTGLFSVALGESTGSEVLAVDVKADRLQTGARVAAEKGLTNVRFLRARIEDQLVDLLPAASVDDLWITFPDPFPKKRFAKNRLMHPKFLALYQRLLRPTGALYFKTDAHDLFTWSLEQLVWAGWTIRELSFDLHESDLPAYYKVKTSYESRFTAEGLPTHFVKATPPLLSR